MIRKNNRTALQRQTAVTAYLKSKQLLLFVLAGEKSTPALTSSITWSVMVCAHLSDSLIG